jgi:hypothetical protein
LTDEDDDDDDDSGRMIGSFDSGPVGLSIRDGRTT